MFKRIKISRFFLVNIWSWKKRACKMKSLPRLNVSLIMVIPSINLSLIILHLIGLIIWLLKWFLGLMRGLDMLCIGLELKIMVLLREFRHLRCRRLYRFFFIWQEIRMLKLLLKKLEQVLMDILLKSLFQGIFLKIWNKESKLQCLVLKLLAKVLLLVSLYPDRKMMAVD